MLLTLGFCLAAVGKTDQLQIGNLLTTAPNGIAFIAKGTGAFVMDPGGSYYAGDSAPNGTYHRTVIDAGGKAVTFEWGSYGNSVVGRLRANESTEVTFDLTKNWPGWQAKIADGKAMLGDGISIEWRTEPAITRSDPKSFTVRVEKDHETKIVAGAGPLPSFAEVDGKLDTAKKAYDRTKPAAAGDFGNFLGAIPDNLNNSKVFSSDNNLTPISVSRGWAPDPNGAPYFCWDSFFNGNLASLDDPEVGKETIRAILSCQTKEGLVPNYGHWRSDAGRDSTDRSQPPMGSMCAWKLHQRAPSIGFLREVYPKLLAWHRWWPEARDGRHDGLLEWGSSKQGMQEALWETGWDDTVAFEGSRVAGDTLDAYAVDLNSMWAMDALYLARIADATGHKKDAEELRAEYAKTKQLINEKLWNPELGTYCNRLWSGKFITRLTPMNFYPFIAGIPDSEQAAKMLKVLTDPKLFWGDWVLPTVAYNDPVWPHQDYWRGKVWGPVNYIVFQGLLQYASPEILNEYAAKSVHLFMRNWEKDRVCGENYLSKDGSQSSDPHYTWGALLCLIQLENTVGFLPDGRIRLNGTQNATFELQNVRLGGKLYDVSVSPYRAELKLGGRTILAARNEVKIN